MRGGGGGGGEEEEEEEGEEEGVGAFYYYFIYFCNVSFYERLENSMLAVISHPSLPPSPLSYRCWASCLRASMASKKFVWRGNVALPLLSSGMSLRQARLSPVLMNISSPPRIR